MELSSLPTLSYRPRLPGSASRLRLCSDEQLVERFRAGRDEAFRVIHDRYRARLFAYVRQMLAGRASEDVEDAVQDIFERAARMLRADAAPIGLRSWLYSVAHNRCIDELRRRPPAAPDVFAASRLPARDTSAVAERRADVERLFADLHDLPELQRSALLMRELQGLSHAEMAQALDASVPSVKSLLVRARVGLVDAEEARDAPCASIRDDLAATHDRRVKASALAARHLRDCAACRSYRTELRRNSRRLAALIPGPTLFPLALIGRLLGGGGVHAEAPVAATGFAGSGAALAGAGKVAVLLGATVLATGAVLERNGALDGKLPWSSPSKVHRASQANATPGFRSGHRTTSTKAVGHRGHAIKPRFSRKARSLGVTIGRLSASGHARPPSAPSGGAVAGARAGGGSAPGATPAASASGGGSGASLPAVPALATSTSSTLANAGQVVSQTVKASLGGAVSATPGAPEVGSKVTAALGPVTTTAAAHPFPETSKLLGVLP